ncbi:hypothetical protein DQ04_00021210 [Trypanosoma grayi]|uniref:hypothetical protein n=1 Tax=Trypanosoma grayi TaxID=71804 RepID=UPI0004F49BC1|nr:hypothetical protein DQ04_00021210 [Trypanosoma grayi]KEG15623.1 hypothetical protein DQ04_00021210 [Trypanosoma grayi]
MEHLPSINSRVETLRLVYGSVVRLCLHSFVYGVTRGVFSEYVLRRKGSLAWWGRQSVPYVASLGMEIGVSVLICPVRYFAAVSAPRFILDYTLTGWSELLRVLDRFSPGNFAAYALYAFSSDADWNLDFFIWQLPSVVLTVTKLWYRRRLLGSVNCRTKRVLGMIPVQVFLRAFLSSFSLLIPESGGEVLVSVVLSVLENAATSYLAMHTWPFSNVTDSPQSSTSNQSDSREAGSDDVHAKPEETS